MADETLYRFQYHFLMFFFRFRLQSRYFVQMKEKKKRLHRKFMYTHDMYVYNIHPEGV